MGKHKQIVFPFSQRMFSDCGVRKIVCLFDSSSNLGIDHEKGRSSESPGRLSEITKSYHQAGVFNLEIFVKI